MQQPFYPPTAAPPPNAAGGAPPHQGQPMQQQQQRYPRPPGGGGPRMHMPRMPGGYHPAQAAAQHGGPPPPAGAASGQQPGGAPAQQPQSVYTFQVAGNQPPFMMIHQHQFNNPRQGTPAAPQYYLQQHQQQAAFAAYPNMYPQAAAAAAQQFPSYINMPPPVVSGLGQQPGQQGPPGGQQGRPQPTQTPPVPQPGQQPQPGQPGQLIPHGVPPNAQVALQMQGLQQPPTMHVPAGPPPQGHPPHVPQAAAGAAAPHQPGQQPHLAAAQQQQQQPPHHAQQQQQQPQQQAAPPSMPAPGPLQQPQMMVPTSGPPIPPQSAAAKTYQKRKKNAIKIINPDTQEEVTADNEADKANKAKVTKPVEIRDPKDVEAEAAAAAASSKDNKSEKESDAASEKATSKPKEASAPTPAATEDKSKAIHTDKIHSGDNKTSGKEDKKEAAAPAKKEEKPKPAKEVEPAKEAAPAKKAEVAAKEEPSSDAGKSSASSSSSTAAAAAAAAATAQKKKSPAARKAELNRKGNEKLGAGSDMDIFQGSAAETSAPAPVKQPEQPKPAPVETPKVTPAPVTVVEKEEVEKKAAPVVNNVPKKEEAPKPAAVAPEKKPEEATSPKSDSGISDASPPPKAASEEPAAAESEPAKLKYKYSDDQWSPMNTAGKKQYDRAFLMQLQADPLSLAKPSNLPNMEIIKDKGNERAKMSNMGSAQKDFMPNYVRPTMSKGPMNKKSSQNGGPPGGNKPGGDPPRRIITVPSIRENIKLHSAENAWKPAAKKEASGVEDEQAILSKKVRGILNKLTPQKFDTLVQRFKELKIDNDEKLNLCIDLVFEKALDEPGFSEAYARMCEVLKHKSADNHDGAETPAQQVPAGQPAPLNFRRALLKRCQDEFMRDYMEGLDKPGYEKEFAAAETEEKQKELRLAWEEKERKARKRSLGNIRFIGELYKLNILTANIMHECVKKLLLSIDEESLECLCNLLTTVGKKLEDETYGKICEQYKAQQSGARGSQSKQPPPPNTPFINYFLSMDRIIREKKTSARVRFLLQDLIDLRKNKWIPRREATGPKTIDQIHKEVAQEQNKQQLDHLMNKNIGGGGGRDRDRDRGGNRDGGRGNRDHDGRKHSQRGGGGGPNQSEDGWTVASRPSQNRVNERIDASRLSKLSSSMMSQKVDSETMTFGPPGVRGASMSAWGKGSSGTRHSQTKEPQVAAKNRFDMLSDSGSGGGMSSGFDSSQRQASRSMGGPPGRNSRGPSADTDRSAALNLVKNMAGGRPSGAPGMGGPTRTAMAPPPAASQAEPTVSNKLKGPSNMKDEEVQKQAGLILDEFLSVQDVKEAVTCVEERLNAATMHTFVCAFFETCLEKRMPEQTRAGGLLAKLLSERLVVPSSLRAGLETLFEFAADLEVDVPTMWDAIARVIAPLHSVAVPPLPLAFHAGFASSLEGGMHGKLIAAVLRALDKATAGRLWAESGLGFGQFVKDAEVEEFVKKHGFEFLASASSSGSAASSGGASDDVWDGLTRQITKILNGMKTFRNHTELTDFVEREFRDRKSDPKFARSLTTALAEFCIVMGDDSEVVPKTDRLTELAPFLKRYVDSDVNLQKQVLYALQAVVHQHEHPNQMLYMFFETLNDQDVVCEEAFYAWETCTDPAEQKGKGVCIKGVTRFFTWLREAEDVEEDEE